MEEIDLLFTTPYLQVSSNNQPDPRPVMEKAIRELETKPAPTQRVLAQQTRQVAVYKANMLFAAIAVGMSFLATLLITLLFTGWQHLGRSFSASPLEIAKAFDAPLLRDAGSNVSGDEIAKSHGDVKVRYGEAIEEKTAKASHARTGDESATEPETTVSNDGNSSSDRHRSQVGDRHTAAVNADVDAEADRNAMAQDAETVERGEANGLIAATSEARLVIDWAERLSIPVRGRAYF
ncbi:hypothetical protein F5X68DRAFT_210194 [Plectosphaerella plurivora]|uniref:Uncharacterized protein n=1 Tax=Plectosphaerella plurivora TaxID=936078 RepID=A0A9P8V7U0_9PEZI|nr:hypothetical protein F5X68DRAFT_210194 [Plectosphaerella plurivora]